MGVGGYPERFNAASALAKFQAGGADIVERRGGCAPVGGVLRNITNTHGLLIGDAAGAVSPLTAGGLDACMRLSAFTAKGG